MNPIKIARGDTVTLRYQIKEDGVAKDVTGMSVKLAVKKRISDTTYKISPVTGDLDVPANGKISFTLTDTETDQPPFSGKFEAALYSASGEKTTLSSVGGDGFSIVEDIVT